MLLHNYSTTDPAAGSLTPFTETYCIEVKDTPNAATNAAMANNTIMSAGSCFEVVGCFSGCDEDQPSGDVSVYQGAYLEIPVRIIDKDGIVQPITGEVRFLVKGGNGVAISKTSVDPDIDVLNQTTNPGQATIYVFSPETAALAQGNYLYEIYIDVAGEFFRVAFGVFEVV